MIPALAGALLVLLPFWWCARRGETPESYGLSWEFSRKGARECAVITAAVLAALTLASVNWPGESLPRRMPALDAAKWAANGISAAIIEEVFFRGWIQPLFRMKLGAAASVILTSVVFALAHIFVAQAFFIAAVFFPGCVMGILRERHGNISTSTMFHALGNLWAVWFVPTRFPGVGELLRSIWA